MAARISSAKSHLSRLLTSTSLLYLLLTLREAKNLLLMHLKLPTNRSVITGKQLRILKYLESHTLRLQGALARF